MSVAIIHSPRSTARSAVRKLCSRHIVALRLPSAIVLALAILCLMAGMTMAASPAPAAQTRPYEQRLPGVGFAEGISQITGTSVSPLLGVSSIGAWHYFRTPAALRGDLPWYCHPWAWGTGLFLLTLCFIKDLFGTVMPPVVKKPFDVLELLESKLSALVASAAFVPLIASQMAQGPAPAVAAHFIAPVHSLEASIFAFPLANVVLQLLLVPFCVVSFLVVWMACHAINVLIVLCPFGFIDAVLKLFKLFLVFAVLFAYLIAPWLGAALSLLMIFAAVKLAPGAFRFAVFGSVFALDILAPWRARHTATPARAHAFVARATAGIPARTYGRISRTADGSLCFSFRPALIFPVRTIPLTGGVFVISRGYIFPSLLQSPEPSGGFVSIIHFPPRYHHYVQEIAEHFMITDIQETTLSRGFAAARRWFAEIFHTGQKTLPQFQATSNLS